jgi:hypothetical protein
MRGRGRPPKNSVPDLDDTIYLFEIWNRALASPYGVAIASAKPNILAQRLYAARRECGHNSYNSLKIVECKEEVWIQPR